MEEHVEAPSKFELGSLNSESRVPTITPCTKICKKNELRRPGIEPDAMLVITGKTNTLVLLKKYVVTDGEHDN